MSAPRWRSSALEKAKADDETVAEVYERAGIKTFDLDQAHGRQVAGGRPRHRWKDYAEKSASNAEFLKLSQRSPGGVKLLEQIEPGDRRFCRRSPFSLRPAC